MRLYFPIAPSWFSILLTFSQAVYIAGALPRPQLAVAQEPTGTTTDAGVTTTSSASESILTFVNPELQLQTVASTDLPNSQTPTTTDASQNVPDTTGLIVTSLETDGNPPVQPFPTNVPSVSEATLSPLPTSAPFANTTSVSESTATQTITIPLTTYEAVVATSTVTSIPVETTITLTTEIDVSNTYSADSSTVTSISTGTTVITTVGTVLIQTTLSGSSTLTSTIATTITTDGIPSSSPTMTSSCPQSMACGGQDIFLPVDIVEPPTNIPQEGGHPVPRLGINQTYPIETNKFYANFFLGSQSSPSFTTPYSMSWSKGSGNAMSWGMAISHIDGDQRVYGPPNDLISGDPDSYYINPIGIQSLIMSAAELQSSTVLTSDSLEAMSANIHLSPGPGSSGSISFPLVQGMGFVTGIYNDLQPAIQSSVFFNNVASAGSPKPGLFKYRMELEDGTTWLLYAAASNGLGPNFRLSSSTLMTGLQGWSGSIQIAKNPGNSSEFIYDNAAGAFATSTSLSGYASGASASYGLSFGKSGFCADNTTLLMFALPHHMQSFDNNTAGMTTTLQLQTLTKGVATAVVADCWVLEENNMPIDMGFAPWRPNGHGNVTTLSETAIATIQNISVIEASQNMSAQTDLNSMYYSGKALSKFATICYVMNDLVDQPELAAAALVQLKSAFAVFVDNQQPFPLLYDTDWKGLVSSASYVTGDPGEDFGNSYYNDHHFHYGYFLHAAAIIGYLDPTWLSANKDYVNTMVRDVANPNSLDQYFPIFRSFDWYNGHSWAHGLFESGDGKDEESSSEDSMFAFGMKMWGNTIGDASMEARGNLMLSVLARSLQNYFLWESSNQNVPPEVVGNKNTGILFENKVDHATYFGANLEYTQGIHMIPLMPFSTLCRTQQFVAEEWVTYFANGAADPATNVTGGWRGILYANLAIIDPSSSWGFFSQENFDSTWIDGGASLTWYLAWAAGLGGSPP